MYMLSHLSEDIVCIARGEESDGLWNILILWELWLPHGSVSL